MDENLEADVDLIGGVKAVPSILDVVCRTTGMGFAAVARVTPERWIACAILDNIDFGLKPGGELKIETTICHEIQQTAEEVVIDDVSVDEVWCTHHSPKTYGYRSYISVPIRLPDGSFFGTLCAIDPQPNKLRGTEVVGMFRLFADLVGYHVDSARKLADAEQALEQRREADRRQRVLQRELSHRMKNTLAMVQAVVTQSLRDATSLSDAAQRTTERIQALGRAQDMLTETNWEVADIRAVVAAAIAPHLDGGHRFAVTGPSADLTAQQSLGLSLAIHELATNAAKYGALSNATGRIAVEWQVDPDRSFRFSWRETGGPPVVAPGRKGFGSRLTVRVVPSYFRGSAQLDYPAEGAVFDLSGSL